MVMVKTLSGACIYSKPCRIYANLIAGELCPKSLFLIKANELVSAISPIPENGNQSGISLKKYKQRL